MIIVDAQNQTGRFLRGGMKITYVGPPHKRARTNNTLYLVSTSLYQIKLHVHIWNMLVRHDQTNGSTSVLYIDENN